MDIDQIIRCWLAGEKIRAIARATGADRNTVLRIVRIADKEGIGRAAPWPDEGKLPVIRQRMGRPGLVIAVSESEQLLKPRTEQIRAWLDKDHLLLRGATLVPSSASLTASSLRLRFLYGSWRSPRLPNATLTIATEEGSC